MCVCVRACVCLCMHASCVDDNVDVPSDAVFTYFWFVVEHFVPFSFFYELFPVCVNRRQKEAASQEVLINKLQASLAQIQDRCRAQEQVGDTCQTRRPASKHQHQSITTDDCGHCFLFHSVSALIMAHVVFIFMFHSVSYHGPCGLYFHVP